MSKSSREKRARMRAEAARAVASGDVASIEALAASSPERAAEALAIAVAREGCEARTIAIAEDLAAKLRRKGSFGPARKVACAGEKVSSVLRLETALVAFASGDDVEADRALAADPSIGAIMGPLVAAARGDLPADRPAQTRGRTQAAVELHVIARAVSLARAGKARDAGKALSRVRRERRVLVRDAISLAEPASGPHRLGAIPAYDRIARAAETQHLQGVVEAALLDLAGIAPDHALKEARRREVNAGIVERIEARTGRRRSRSFTGPDAGAAWIHEGFARLADDPDEADRAFDAAVETGGDLVEALRGKLLAARRRGSMCGHCDTLHSDPEKVAPAADRLARALRRVPMGSFLAGEAALLVAEARVEGNGAAALRAIEEARADWRGRPNPRADLVEAEVKLISDPERALALVDRFLDADPENPSAIGLKMTALTKLGRTDERQAILRDIALTTRDPELRRMARNAARTPPFEGLAAGSVSAGALAAELDRVLLFAPRGTEDDPMNDVAWACRDALGEADRLAFDAALLFMSSEHGVGPSSEDRLAALVVKWAPATEPIFWLSAFCESWPDEPPDRIPAARALAALPGSGPLLVALARGAIAGDADAAARDILRRFADRLSRAEITEIKRSIGRSDLAGLEQQSDKIERTLAPDYGFWASECDDTRDGGHPASFALFPPAFLSLVPPALRARIESVEQRIKSAPPFDPPPDDLAEEVEAIMRDVARFLEQSGGKFPPKTKGAKWL